jgi:hypothetical protein
MILASANQPASVSTKHSTDDRGVETWVVDAHVSSNQSTTPIFFRDYSELSGLKLPETDLPFGRSVALLVGVSKYHHLSPNLPGAENDLTDLRDYLLGPGGFDEVFTVMNDFATPALIEDFMINRFRRLNRSDRLLFYFAGHSADIDSGITGYLQFANAIPDDFAQEVLPISHTQQWSRAIGAGHVLFIFDTCVSGLAFLSRGEIHVNDERELLETLSGNGSRIVITAGTGDESAFEILDGNGRSVGVFTRSLLKALESPSADGDFASLVNAHQVFGDLKTYVGAYAANYHFRMTPQIFSLDPLEHSGEFLFLNWKVKDKPVAPSLALRLGAVQPLGVSQPAPPIRDWTEIALGLDDVTRQGQNFIVSLGNVDEVVKTYVLQVHNLADQDRLVDIRVEGNGISAEFEGSTWSTVVSRGKATPLRMRVSPKQFAQTDRVRFVGGGKEIAAIRINLLVTDPTRLMTKDSGERLSGSSGDFSPAYRVCLGSAPPGYTLVRGSEEFWLTGDRRCGAWSTCEWIRRDDEDVCFAFSLQGHNEDLHNGGQRLSEGHLKAQYKLVAAPPGLTVQPTDHLAGKREN